AVPNGVGGIRLLGGSGNTIGGTTTAARNLISGNTSYGIYLHDNGSDLIEGNYIGTDVSGGLPLGNVGDGIQFDGGIASNNTIRGNVISANSQFGISFLNGSGSNTVAG